MRLTVPSIETLAAVQRHGPLSFLYVNEVLQPFSKDRDGNRKRCLALTRGGYLDRPVQLNDPRVKNDYKIYTLTEKGKEALGAAGRLHAFAKPCGGGYAHMVMCAAITASIEIECMKRGLRYLSQEEILRDAPETTRKATLPLAIPCTIERIVETRVGKQMQRSTRPCEPDNIFGIEYAPRQRRFFALEADRGTESIWRHDLKDNSIQRKILSYCSMFKNNTFMTHFGLNKLYPTFVTTAAQRADDMIEQLKHDSSEFLDLFLFNDIEGFLIYNRTPSIFSKLLGPYKRASEPFDISKA